MMYTRFLALFCAVVCAFGLCAGASAVEVDSGSTYCFGTGDFLDEEIAGICITDLPENIGALMLGSRVLREGDVLTAEQISRMTLSHPAGNIFEISMVWSESLGGYLFPLRDSRDSFRLMQWPVQES